MATTEVTAKAPITDAKNYGSAWGVQLVMWEEGIGTTVHLESRNSGVYTGKRAVVRALANGTGTITIGDAAPVAFIPPAGTGIQVAQISAILAAAVSA